MYFSNNGLREFEKLMKQPPGYVKRHSGYQLQLEDDSAVVFTKKEMDELMQRFIAYKLLSKDEKIPKGSPENIEKKKDKFFRNEEHENLMRNLFGTTKKMMLKRNRRYLAAVFLLSANPKLWELVNKDVTDTGIFFEDIKIKRLDLEQYVLFHTARDIYCNTKFVKDEELADPSLVPDELFDLIVNAFLLMAYGIFLFEMIDDAQI